MYKNGTTAILEFDASVNMWNETSGSIKHRIRDMLGFAKHEIILQDTSMANGVAERVAFTVRGLGWVVCFDTGEVSRAEQYDDANAEADDDADDDADDETDEA